MADIATTDKTINDMILSGQALDAFEKYYAEDCVMMENETACVGKEANRKREHEFFSSVEDFHGAELKAAAVDGKTSFSEWVFDITFKGGSRVKMEQTAVRRYNDDGSVVHERFYYNGAH